MATTKQFTRTVEAINVLLDKLDNLPVVPMAKKGTLMNPSYLPEDAKEGDVYLVLYSDSGNTQTANSLYYKTASNWEIIATKGYTPYEIDQMFEAVGGGLHWKGAVSYYSNLPSNAELGDMWTVLYEGSSGSEQSGDEYAWGTLSGTEQWILIGKETYSKAQIDDKLDNIADNAELSTYTAGAGTSFETVATTDTVTDAIEKVQNNALFNKTNILSSLEANGQKNLIPYPYASGDSYSSRGILVTSDNDGTIHITGANDGTGNVYYALIATSSPKKILENAETYTFTINATGTGTINQIYINQIAPSISSVINIENVVEGTYSNNITFTESEGYTGVAIIVKVNATNTGTINMTLKIMLDTKAINDIDSSYAPYAMSNYELTQAILALSATRSAKSASLPDFDKMSDRELAEYFGDLQYNESR